MKESKRQKIKRIIASIMTWIVVFTQYPIDGTQRSNADEVEIPAVEAEIYLSEEAFEMQYGTTKELHVSANLIRTVVSGDSISNDEASANSISINELTYTFDKEGIVSYTLDPDTEMIKLEPTGIGTTKLTVSYSYSNSSAECLISVNSAVSNLRIEEPNKSILRYKYDTGIEFSASYDGIMAENESLKWKSNSKEVIYLGENGNEAVGTSVTGTMKNPGSANIELIYMDGSSESEGIVVSANTIQLVETIEPTIKIKDDEGSNEKIYDGSEYISSDKFDVSWPEGVNGEDVCREIYFKADSADVGERKVTVSFDCVPDSELTLPEMDLKESFFIRERVISMNGVTISGSREYEKGNVDIPDDAVTYSFEGVLDKDKDEIKGAGIVYKLETDDVGENKTIIVPELNGEKKWLTLSGNKAGNYLCPYDPSVSVNSYFSITPKTLTISSNGISKQSDGTTTVSLNSSSEIYLLGSDGETIDDISISVNNTAAWNYDDPKPGKDKKISGAEPADFYISESVNYVFEINLKGDITFKPVDQNIDLRTGETTLKLEPEVTVSFNKAKSLSADGIKWYSGDIDREDSPKFGLNDPTALFVEMVDDELKEINNIELTEGYDSKKSVYIKKNFDDGRNVYYGPVVITYAYDNSIPKADVYSISGNGAITIAVEPEDDLSGIHAVYAHVFSFNEGKTGHSASDYKTEGPLDKTEDSIYTISFDSISGYVGVLVEDNVGNYYTQWANITDFEAPELTIDDSSIFEKEGKYNADNNLKYMTINCNVTDSGAENDSPSGIKEVAYYLLDGRTGDVPEWELYNSDDSTRFEIASCSQNEAMTDILVSISLSGDTCPGYKLRVIVEAVDYNHNRSFNIISYDGNSISKNGTVYTNKAVSENDAFYCKNINEVCDKLDPGIPTFAIDGTMTMITIKDGREESSNKYGDVYYFDVKGTDIGDGRQGRKLSVSFNQMGFESIVLQDSVNSQNTGTIYAKYVPNHHCYMFSENKSIIFPEQTGDELPYTVSFNIPGAINTNENELPFGDFDFPDQNKIFIVDGTVPTVSINWPDEDGSHENTSYYDEPVTVTISINDAHLPKADSADIAPYFDIFDKSGSVKNDDLKSKIEWDKKGNTLIGTLLFKQDANFEEFVVKATDLTLRDMVSKRSGKTFIIDTIPPVFTISYNEQTNKVAVSGNGVSSNNVYKYYYGLQGGDGDPTDVIVTINIKERNLFYEKVSIAVSNNVTKKGYDSFNSISADWVSTYVYDKTCDTATFTFTIPGIEGGLNDGEYQVEVSYEDPVHHKMIASDDQMAAIPVENGKYDGSEHISVIDTIRPKAKFSITKLKDDKYSFENDADYYNFPFTGTFTVDETNFCNDVEYIFSDVLKFNEEKNAFEEVGNGISASANDINYSFAYEVSGTDQKKEGEYKYVISGKDLAKNKLLVTLGDGCTDNDVQKKSEEQEENNEEQEENNEELKEEYSEYYTSGTKVYDVTAPVVKLDIKPSAGVAKKERQTFEGKTRYYFNDAFSADFTIEEKNFCNGFVKPKYGYVENTDNYALTSVSANIPYQNDFNNNEEGANSNEYSLSYKYEEYEGLYRFSIFGEDKAGNGLVKYTDSEGKTSDIEDGYPVSVNMTCYNSFIVALDKTKPQLVDIEIGDFYKAQLLSDDGEARYQVSQNHPYQRLDSTTVKFIRSDKSPANISYNIASTIGNKSRTDVETFTYGYGTNGYVCTVPMDGQQVFYIDSIEMVDFAGNALNWGGDSTKIYLDVTPPNHDELAPTVQAAAIADGSGRGPQGNPLFASDVDVRITVEDPNEVVSSSGLYQLFYRVLVNGEDMTGTTTPSTTTGAAGGGVVSFLSSGPTYSEDPENSLDEELIYRSELNFHFDKNTYNCNDIKIYVWGGDDAGNEIPENNAAYYAFGIDSTNPTITVSYDNNDVRNEKYFKADRTATVTVMERNFDPTRTVITTEAGARIGGWEYRRGNSANGDDDKWISHVRYDHDGNYTFNVTAIDLVGNEAPPANYGESAAPKAFVVDKTVPVINVTFDNNDVHNGKYYNKKRIADVEITEHNFNAADVRISNPVSLDGSRIGSPRISAWEGAGDKKSASLTHSADGDYTLRIDYTDLAGNVAESYVADEFTIDTTAPELIITGVEDKHAYNDKVAPVIEYSDLNLDGDSAKVEISGMLHKENNSLEGVKTQDENGGSLVCSDIEHIKANDDVYKAVGVIKDLAGNETKKEITFSVNRFGSNYIISDETQQLIDKVYTNKEQSIHVTEINVSDLDKNEVDKAVNGNIDVLEDGKHYNLKVSRPGWVQYEYDISAENFAEEGSYVVTLYSEDKAANKNSNRSVRDENGVNELPIEFVVDKTAPSIIVSGVEQNGRYYDRERTIILHYEDNNIATRLEVTDALGNVTVYYLDAYYDGSEDSRDIRKVAPASQYIAIQPNAEGDIELKIQALNSKQSVSIKAVDAAGNETEFSSPRFLLTTNLFVQFINNTAAIIISLVVLALAGAIVLVIVQRRRKKNNA